MTSGQFVDRIKWDYLITEFIDGRPIRELRDSLSRNDLINIATDLGEIIRVLHETDLKGLEKLTRNETGTQLAQRRKVEVVSEIKAKGLLPANVLIDLKSFLETATIDLKDHEAVLVHGDLTEDHLFLGERDGRWTITGLLNFGDAHLCPREYEWPALWLDLLKHDIEALRAFFDSYDPTTIRDGDFTRRAFVWTLLHDFGTEMVEDVLKRHDASQLRSVDDLRELLWPSSMLEA